MRKIDGIRERTPRGLDSSKDGLPIEVNEYELGAGCDPDKLAGGKRLVVCTAVAGSNAGHVGSVAGHVGVRFGRIDALPRRMGSGQPRRA